MDTATFKQRMKEEAYKVFIEAFKNDEPLWETKDYFKSPAKKRIITCGGIEIPQYEGSMLFGGG